MFHDYLLTSSSARPPNST